MAATQPDSPADIRPAPGGGHRLRLRRPLRHQGAAPLRRRRHDGRQDHPPPLPAAALPGGDRHPLRRARSRRRPARSWPARRTPRCCSARSPASTSTAQTVTSQVLGRETVTPYDSLIVAAGAGQSYFGNDHFAEFAPGMKSIDDALELRGRIFGAFEMAELGATRGENVDHLLTFVVVGAGPTGVEMAGQIAELAHRTLHRDFRAINTRNARVDPGRRRRRRCCRRSAPSSAPRPRRELEKLGVEVHPRRDGHRRRRARHRDEVQGRPRRADRDASPRSGPPASRPTRSAAPCPSRPAPRSTAPAGSRSTPTSPCPGHPEVFVVGDMIDLDHLPGRRPGRDPGREVRRQGDRPPAEGQAAAEAVPLLRQGLDGDHQPVPRGGADRQAPAHRRARLADVAGACTSSTSPASRTGSRRCCTGRSRSSAAAARSGPRPSSRSSRAAR